MYSPFIYITPKTKQNSHNTQMYTKMTSSSDEDTPHYSTPIFQPAPPPPRHRSSSFSSNSWDSSSSSSFSFSDELQFSPLKFKGIPFSWEKIPGIPKHQMPIKNKNSSSSHLLPLPPAGNSNSGGDSKKLLHQEEISPKKSNRFQRDDPFFAALVECSKDDHDLDQGNVWKGNSKNIITRTLSDRFGFINMYSSCKRTCAVSESLVHIPRQSPHYLLNRRSSQ